ncbi:helix-turn-helix transcriptional regulator [Chitinophaga sp. LS1]|uniref:helix-turn-helix domain-containing protein n=1 Tax=Chitinophaga sp. LS1 TaxID=3051176 RepID=UPI002AABEEAD|nr:helix-turn-helix transcriptional regulator [Chitinophaga sp. LS1]WPV67546.1 helix-turn-helix transcriptional regulator [Chitinophaga sp. LS1]
MEIELKEFGKNLRDARKKKGLTLDELAVISELDSKQIGKIENGLVDIRLKTLIKLIRALDIAPNDLISREK